VPSALALGLALTPGCRDATQVTLEISLAPRAACAETNGTAITVGSATDVTERHVRDGAPTTTTSSCNDATREIGTLVVTPGEDGRASVIVVVSYDKAVPPSACMPPLFKGCIVARRQFAFADHKGLRMPITIDPSCKDVPCDAFSTCRTGTCFPAETPCAAGTCTEPGDPGDGGTAEGGTDAALDGPATGDGGADAADGNGEVDGGDGGTLGGSNLITCNKGALFCASSVCSSPGHACCESAAGTRTCIAGHQCTDVQKQYCCVAADCPADTVCLGATVKLAGECRPNVQCNTNVLACPPTPGATPAVCGPATAAACCTTPTGTFCTPQPACVVGQPRYCCTDADCGSQGTCTPGGGSIARTCIPPAIQ
jgi:hypothetical protein